MAELGRKDYISEDFTVNNLELNSDALYQLGGRYVFSAVEIKNYTDNSLEFLNPYSKDGIPIKVYLYKFKNDQKVQSN